MNKKAYGFTIVELLIVIVVIGILAAISIVAYNGISNQANDSAVKKDLADNARRIEMAKTISTTGTYPTEIQLGASDNRLKFSKGSYQTSNNAVLFCRSADGRDFALIGKSKSNTTYFIKNGSSVAEYTYSFPTGAANDCPNAGTGLAGAGWIHHGGNWEAWVD